MYWNVIVRGNWVGTVVAPTYEQAITDAAYEFGPNARPVLVSIVLSNPNGDGSD